MPNFNQITLVGNLTRDTEIRYTAKGKAVAKIGIAVNDKWTDEHGEKKERVMFIDCQLWDKAAETFAQYTRKGSCVLINGRLQLDQWEHEGENYSKHTVTVESFQFLDRKPTEEKPNANSRPATKGAAADSKR